MRPSILRAARPQNRFALMETIFYDGDCGLCHAMVRFLVRRDARGIFEYAPLGGEYFHQRVPAEQRAALPQSVVLRAENGALLVRSAAVLHALRRLGGTWRALAAIAGIFPSRLLDWLYDRIAAIRKRLFAPPPGICPAVPGHLRARFHV
jgi:predicted DCC family thiol-disulfide oxidoreductase YuxK